ncbi:hypothetical protein [Micromonospora tarensis]|uniref:Tetratricopeptide repeat-containing protein n=1 Tax=Micromonospora tarensis TaxID=2806100 RepID=A0ABS1YG31_9ACTN|nr:hypothetical protein [Micromonospora tarensis]MBM0276166.1 hypothetical protein [Micromonospora tarensis]
MRSRTTAVLGYLSDDLDEARRHHLSSCEAAAETGHAPSIARVLVGVADLALRRDRYVEAARLLAAGTAVRGRPDHSQPDVARIEQAVRRRLGEEGFAEAALEGTRTSWRELVAVTLAW